MWKKQRKSGACLPTVATWQPSSVITRGSSGSSASAFRRCTAAFRRGCRRCRAAGHWLPSSASPRVRRPPSTPSSFLSVPAQPRGPSASGRFFHLPPPPPVFAVGALAGEPFFAAFAVVDSPSRFTHPLEQRKS